MDTVRISGGLLSLLSVALFTSCTAEDLQKLNCQLDPKQCGASPTIAKPSASVRPNGGTQAVASSLPNAAPDSFTSPHPTSPETSSGSSLSQQFGSLNFNSSAISMVLGEERDLSLLLRDQHNQIPTSGVLWRSSDLGVLSINSSSGRAQVLKQGNVVVTASALDNPDIRTQLNITITESRQISNIEISPAQPVLNPNGKQKLSARVYLADGQINGDVSWSSSDPKIVSVSDTGEITGLSEGTATVLATYNGDTRYRGSAIIKVTSAFVPVVPAGPATPVVSGSSPQPGVSATPDPSATSSSQSSSAPTPAPTTAPTATPTPAATAEPPRGNWYLNAQGSGSSIFMLNATSGVMYVNSGGYRVTQDGWQSSSTIKAFPYNGTLPCSQRADKRPLMLTEQTLFFPLTGNCQSGLSYKNNFKLLTSSDQGQTLNSSAAVQINSNGKEPSANQLWFENATTGYYFGGAYLFKTSNSGQSWTSINLPSGLNVYALHTLQGKLWIAGVIGSQTVLYAYEEGLGWAEKTRFPGSPNYQEFAVSGETFWLLLGPTLYNSTDNGNTWKLAPPKNSLDQPLSLSPSRIFFTDAEHGWIANGKKIYSTHNGGATWHVTPELPVAVSDLHMVNANLGWAVGSAGLLRFAAD